MQFTYPGFITVFIFTAVFALTLYYLLRKPRGKAPYGLLLLLRLIVLLILFLIIFQPTAVFYDKKDKPRAAILIDQSYSMSFSDRIQSVRKFLSKNSGSLKKNFLIDAYGFSPALYPLKDFPPKELKAAGSTTDIGGAIFKVTADRSYDAIFLISDGANNTGVDAGDAARAAGIPVFTIRPEETTPPKDVSIVELKSSDFIFKNITADVTIKFRANGFVGKEATVYIKKGKDVVSSKKKIIDSTEQEMTLSFTSSRLGQDVYSAEIVPFPEETVTDNNSREFTVETVREKIRILYICGQPSSEYYFLRQFIKSNPSMELVSFVILRNPENVAVVPDEQLSLIPFPGIEIFTRELYDYDIVALENFAYARFYITQDYLTNLARFVREKGGSLLMIGGDTGFARGGYAGTPVEDILPVKLDRPDAPIEEGLFKPRLVDATHPVAMLGDTREETINIWNNLPALEGRQRIGPKPGASIIADDPSVKVDGANAVIIACAEIGKGRSMAVGPNTTWRWQMGGGPYSKFWENSLYWLSGGEATKKFRVSLKQKIYYPGDEIEIKILTLGRQFKNRIPVVTITDPMSKTIYIERVMPSPSGWAAYFTPSVEGKYTVKAVLESGREILAQDTKAVAVIPPESTEQEELQVDKAVMDSIAYASGAKSYTLNNFNVSEAAPMVKKKVRRAISRQINFSAQPWMLLPVILLLAVEWVIRRLRGK